MTPSSAQRPTRGFTLLEILVTAMLLGVSVIAATWAMSTTASSKTVVGEEPSTAARLATEIFELADTLPREPGGVVAATNGTPIDALDALVGASFSPPILADGTTESSLGQWRQQVSLAVYDLTDLSAPTADDPAAGIAADAAKIYMLSVTMLEDGQAVDTFDWWLAP